MNNELYHYGVKNMHWGVRRWQNEDGSYKPGGAEHYYTPTKKDQKKLYKDISKATKRSKSYVEAIDKQIDKVMTESKRKDLSEKLKKYDDITYNKLDKAVDDYWKEHEDGDVFEDPKVKKVIEEQKKASEEYYGELEKYTKSLIGNYGNKKIRNVETMRGKNYDRAENIIRRRLYERVHEEAYQVIARKRAELQQGN